MCITFRPRERQEAMIPVPEIPTPNIYLHSLFQGSWATELLGTLSSKKNFHSSHLVNTHVSMP